MVIKAAPLRRDMVKEKIRQMIVDSSMQAGDRLFSEKKLGEILGVNHLTVRSALAELAEQGVVERISGSGTFYTGNLVAGVTGNKKDGPKLVSMMFRSDEHFFGGLQNDILMALQADNFMVATQCCHMEEPEILEDLRQLFSWKAESIIVSQTEIEKTPQICHYFNQQAGECRRVIRLLGNMSCDIPLAGHQVTIDYAGAYRQAVNLLHSLGHRKIAFFGGACETQYSFHQANRKYVSIYTEAMMEAGLADNITIITKSKENEMKQAALNLLTMPERPTAFICLTDSRGVILKDTAAKLGLKVPDDLSIVGFYDTPWSHHYELASFRVRNKELAGRIAELFKRDRVESGLSMVEADLIERTSIGKAPN